LLGLTVMNRSAQVLGRVEGLLESGAHPVLRVAGNDGRERLIPLVPAFLDAIDADNGRIVVMLCAFEGAPRILRIHGQGEVVHVADRSRASPAEGREPG
jgi:hypothetical protein